MSAISWLTGSTSMASFLSDFASAMASSLSDFAPVSFASSVMASSTGFAWAMASLTSAVEIASPASARDHVVADPLRRAWRSQEVEGADRQAQIGKFFQFRSGQVVGPHEVAGCPVGPPELALEPGQPSSVTNEFSALDQTPANLDDLVDGALAELADLPGVLDEGSGSGGVLRLDGAGRRYSHLPELLVAQPDGRAIRTHAAGRAVFAMR
jgi:hypothetical protein